MKTTIGKSSKSHSGSDAPRDPSLQRVFARLATASMFSANAQEIVRLAYRSSSSLDDLQRLIQADPSVVALILRRVNSAYYRLDQQVQDVTSAARLLGFREFRNLAITVYISRMFDVSTDAGTMYTAGLWTHNVAVAAASHLVSRVCGCGVPADAYVAGLLHDIGFLLIDRHMHRRFLDLRERVLSVPYSPALEHTAYEFDHAQLGGYAARQWGFPAAVADAVEFHHDIEGYTGSHRDLLYVVAATDYLCSRAGWTALSTRNLPLPPDSVYRGLGLDQVALAVIWEELLPTLEKATSLAVT